MDAVAAFIHTQLLSQPLGHAHIRTYLSETTQLSYHFEINPTELNPQPNRTRKAPSALAKVPIQPSPQLSQLRGKSSGFLRSYHRTMSETKHRQHP